MNNLSPKKLFRATLLSAGLTAIFLLANWASVGANGPAVVNGITGMIGLVGIGASVSCFLLLCIAGISKIPSQIKKGGSKVKLLESAGSLAPDVKDQIPADLSQVFSAYREKICRVAKLHIKNGFGRSDIYVALDLLDKPIAVAKYRFAKYSLVQDWSIAFAIKNRVRDLLDEPESRAQIQFSAFEAPQQDPIDKGEIDPRLAACELPAAVAEIFTRDFLAKVDSYNESSTLGSLNMAVLENPQRQVFIFALREKDHYIVTTDEDSSPKPPPPSGVVYDVTSQTAYLINHYAAAMFPLGREMEVLWEAPAPDNSAQPPLTPLRAAHQQVKVQSEGGSPAAELRDGGILRSTIAGKKG